jgi:hypothetical protein
MSYLGVLCKQPGEGQGGHEGRNGLLRKESGRAGDTIGAKENPVGVNLRGLTIGLG